MSDPTVRVPFCGSCGTLASPGESYCRQCGKPLQAPTVVSPQPPPAQPINPQPASQPGSQYGSQPGSQPGSQRGVPPPSTITAVSPQIPQMPGAQPGRGPQFQPTPPINVGKKRRSPILLGCLVFLGLIVVLAGIGGIYVWRRSTYTPPDRQAPAIPERAAGTMTEFPVDNDPSDPSRPTTVQTEILGGTLAKNSSSTPSTKLPPGVDRSGLAKGATSMTSSTYRPKRLIPTSGSSTASNQGNVYINVVTTMPNQPNFGDGLATSVVNASGGQRTGVRVQSTTGAIYVGSKIRSSDAYVYILTKQNSDIVIILYSDDPSNQPMVDRLAQSVGNGQGLVDYPEVKESLWTLPASVPSGLTLVEINTISGAQIEAQIVSSAGGSNADFQKFLGEMRSFIPDRLTGARYVDSNRQEWNTLTFEYGSSFSAWRTWLLARGALGLGGAESTTVREVTGVYMNQDGMKILVFQKGPYLIFLSGPGNASINGLVALGNGIQV
jgi:hypothetical protein